MSCVYMCVCVFCHISKFVVQENWPGRMPSEMIFKKKNLNIFFKNFAMT